MKRLSLFKFKKIGVFAAAALVAVAVSLLPLLTSRANAAPALMQGNHGFIGSGSTLQSTLTSPTTAGNLVVAYVVYSTSTSVSLTDNKGNAYAQVGNTTTWGGGYQVRAYYAKNVIGGANTITATFDESLSFGILYTYEYSGLDKVNPLDGDNIAIGNGATLNSGSITTTNANDLIVGLGASAGSVSEGGSEFTVRTLAEGNIVEDKSVTSTGSYDATATHGGGSWVMQVIAFKAASDTQAPTTPTNLNATASSTSEIDLTWDAATDNVGVTGYRITRDTTVLTTVSGSTYNDTGLTAETAYSYTVAALDAAGNVSAESTTATVSTPAAPSNNCDLPNYPNASCTGVPAGTTLVPFNPTCIPATQNGSSCETTAIDGVTKCAYYRQGDDGPISAGYCTIKTAGAVLDGVTVGRIINEGQPNEQLIGGCIVMDAPNVTIRNSKIYCPAVYGISSYGGTEHGGLVVEDVEIDCRHTNTTGIAYQGVVINRAHIHGCENGVDAYRNTTLTNSYIHDIWEGATGHGDGVQSADGTNVTIDHNTILSESTNASININHNANGPTTTNLTISNNFMAGGSYNLYCPIPPTVNTKVLNNRFSTMFYSTIGAFGPNIDCQGELTSGNTWHETGMTMGF